MHKSVVVRCPNFIKPFRDCINREYISIDEDIINVIKVLWDEGIITLCSCQGEPKSHKKELKYPQIVIHSNYRKEDVKLIKSLINMHDKRKWKIYQWDNVLCER